MEAKKALLEAYHNLRGMYDEHDDNTQVLYFTHGTATFSPSREHRRRWSSDLQL